MKHLLLIPLLLFGFVSHASEQKRIAPQFHRVKSEKQSDLDKSKATYRFILRNLDSSYNKAHIIYSVDGKQFETELDNFEFEVNTSPGKHVFILYLNDIYEEMYSDSLSILGGNIDTYNVYTQRSKYRTVIDKPVIYLYPEKETECTVEVEPVGDLSFTYPKYEGTWEFIAHANGTLEFGDKSYNYLFWESKKELEPQAIDLTQGFVVGKEEVLSFLESSLSEAGFTSKEKADFITYWGPRMIAHDLLFVQFVQNEECDQYASLNITPSPDNISRFYIRWSVLNTPIALEPQTILPIDRNGFSVLEWGGEQLPDFTNIQQL